jgi:filamentous hemagglutinin family protein
MPRQISSFLRYFHQMWNREAVIEKCDSVTPGQNVEIMSDPGRAMMVAPHLPSPRSHFPRLPLGLRITATALSILLFLTSSPTLLAITMGQIRAGSATPRSGGQGSFSNLQNAGAASAALTAAMAQGNLKKANEIIVAIKQAQADARKNVTASSVPNGLRPGGLEVYNPSGQVTAGKVPLTWSGVSSLEESRSGISDSAAASVNIMQNQQNAYLYWNKFNVGHQTTVNFNLADNLKENPGQNIAFNKVMSPADPSHILGKINAPGQVYILNQNGILFHNGSAVNTRSLVASTLPINENLAGTATKAGRGIANNPDYQFLFSAVTVPSGKNGPTEEFKPSLFQTAGVARPKLGNVEVEKGATITSPKDENNSGGLVALVGPNVRNEGIISTPNGQTILASGLQVGITPHVVSDPSLRGFDVFIGKVEDASISTQDLPDGKGAGTVLNARNGVIEMPQGSVTMAGKSILQNGVIDGTTSVSLNGRIDLSASYDAKINEAYLSDNSQGPPLFFQKTGLVQSGPESLMRILPEWGSSEKVVGDTLALSSVVSILAQNVLLGKGALLLAPGAVKTSGALSQFESLSQGKAYLSDGVTVDAGNWVMTKANTINFLHNDGQIFLDEDSVIDVAGSTDVKVSSAQNFITLQLRGAELASSPLQRDSVIRGKDIIVDIRRNGTYQGRYWIGTPLGDATGYLGLIERAVGQLTIAGGSVALAAGNSVVMRDGSMVNVSGGWVKYSGGNFSTSKLRTSTGLIIDISKATPDQIYSGIIKDFRSFYEDSYYQGGNGGSLSIQSALVALDGRSLGATVAGFRQVSPLSSLVSQLPAQSSLKLGIFSERFDSGLAKVVNQSRYHPEVRISVLPDSSATRPEFLADLPVSRSSRITLDQGLFGEFGFGIHESKITATGRVAKLLVLGLRQKFRRRDTLRRQRCA